MLLNGTERFTELYGDYFNYVQPYENHINSSKTNLDKVKEGMERKYWSNFTFYDEDIRNNAIKRIAYQRDSLLLGLEEASDGAII